MWAGRPSVVVVVGEDIGESSWAIVGARKMAKAPKKERNRALISAASEGVVCGVDKSLQVAQQRGVGVDVAQEVLLVPEALESHPEVGSDLEHCWLDGSTYGSMVVSCKLSFCLSLLPVRLLYGSDCGCDCSECMKGGVETFTRSSRT